MCAFELFMLRACELCRSIGADVTAIGACDGRAFVYSLNWLMQHCASVLRVVCVRPEATCNVLQSISLQPRFFAGQVVHRQSNGCG